MTRARLEIFKDYVRNIADWLHPAIELAVHRPRSPRREPRDSPEAVNRPPLDGVLTREQRKRERILAVDMKLEVVVLPVRDVDRARQFYEALGWRLG